MAEAIRNKPIKTNKELCTSEHWGERAKAGYRKLGWVTAGNLLGRMVELADLEGNEVVVDAGTGSGAILDALAPHVRRGGRVIGFDISEGMLRSRPTSLPQNASLLVGSIFDIPLQSDIADVVTVRQVVHNLPDVSQAVREMYRILRPGGRLIISEYTPQDEEVLEFEKPVWDMKEPGRNLWTGEQLARVVTQSWPTELNGSLSLHYAILQQYSNRDWMKNSGLPQETQQEILRTYLNLPARIMGKMGLTITEEGDTLVNRPWAYVVAKK